MSELTPLMRQYHDIKRNYPDTILFFRLGDFYEMFGQDAVIASRVLQITLTTRDKGKADPMPMCGIPHFASENYVSKLVRAGHKVAICEQVEDSGEAKGIVKREVVKVVTPGTFLPDNPKENNYILGFFQKENIFGIAVADITTGEFLIYETHNSIEDEINRFQPKEILYPFSFKNNSSVIDGLSDFYLTDYDDWYFDYIEAYRKLIKHFRVASLEGFGCEGMIVGIPAAGALINYLEETQKETLTFKKIDVLRRESKMLLDAATLKNLEIAGNMRSSELEGSLLWLIDETYTPMGGRLLRNWLLNPLLDAEEIKQRQDAVESLMSEPGRLSKIQAALKSIYDIERLASKIGSGTANARDLLSLKNSLETLPELKNLLKEYDDKTINALSNRIDILSDIKSFIEKAVAEDPPLTVREGGLIKKGFNAEIDELREISSSGKDFIASLQARERESTGISSLKVGYNKVFGYYIEVTKANLSQVPEEYIRKQTLVNGERFITPELKEYEAKVLGAEERLKNLEYEVFVKVRDDIAAETGKLRQTSSAIAELDALHSFAHIAKKYNYERPVVDDGDVIQVSESRHPVIEKLSSEEKFIPNDCLIDSGSNKILIITGPNMAGKSTYMRQIALIVLMAQIGSFVPAKEAKVGIVDRIFTRIGASDVITKGQSTFMVEMIETANILNNATERSLILLDEVGRGTSTFDGISIAWAVVEYIAKELKARTLFATHYHELTELSIILDGIKNLNVAVKEWGDEIIFLRRIEEGGADKSYGIQVARLAGLPEETIKRAKEILSNLEKSELNELGAPKLAYTPDPEAAQAPRTGQLDLFTTQADPVIKELLGLDILSMTPIDALNKLFEMRKKLADGDEKAD
ncbi:MAG TPA: DNA mismatch repair protein MutS [Nitrospirae bacterium]|nr:DNA mismatch repair protein MutS [bacterium BMS3Abin06]HDH12035.1 DNA mismatch repair protein MutS [Nitrospirota bacterium]HDZ00855.1 DNA mismatch repair protein MutS [Nitrospirota bacterium]